MTKVTLDMSSFKALASDTRLNILKSLDGKKMNLKDISSATNLNKATLHEHLTKLSEAGLVKRIERKGHKWVYYKLTWKGEGLLHPENTRIVVLFSATFVALAAGMIQLIRFLTTRVSNTMSPGLSSNYYDKNVLGNETMPGPGQGPSEILDEGVRRVNDSINITTNQDNVVNYGIEQTSNLANDPILLYISIACFIIFFTILSVSIWRYNKNKTPKL